MRFTYTILPEKRLSILRFSGSLSLTDISRAAQQFWADRLYNREYDGIADLRDITTRLKIQDLKAIVDFFQKPQAGVGRWAAILGTPKATALGLIFKAALHGPFQLEIVSSWDAAYLALGIDNPEAVRS